MVFVVGTIGSASKASHPFEPTDHSFDRPSVGSKPTAVIGASASDDGLNVQRSNASTDRLTDVATICIARIGMFPRPAGLAAYLRRVCDYWHDQSGAAGIRWAGASTSTATSGLTKPWPIAYLPRSTHRDDAAKVFALKSPLRQTQNEGTSSGTQPRNHRVAARDSW